MKAKCLLAAFALGLGLTLCLLWTLGDGNVLALSPDAPAAELHVCATCPYTTIQDAVDAANDGDIIKVAAGHYDNVHSRNLSSSEIVTQVVLITKSLTIQGGYTATDWNTPNPDDNHTVLDAKGEGRVIHVNWPALTITLEGLHIVNGASTGNGGGVYFRRWGDGSLALRNSHVASNTATAGGGLYVREIAVTLTNNLFQNNTATSSAGGAELYECTSYVAYNTFENNVASDGGGLTVGWGDVTLTHNEFENNTANDSSSYGGGLHTFVNSGHAHSISNNRFQGNKASIDGDGGGGGVYLSAGEGGQLVFSHNDVLDNVATECATQWSQGSGGGLFLYAHKDSSARVSDNLFQGNWAATDYDCTGSGGGLFVNGRVLIERNRILDNRASRYPDWGPYFKVYGGGVYVHSWTAVTMTNNILAGNHYFEEDDNPFAPDYFSNGGAIYVGGQSTPTTTQLILLHNTLVDNQSPAILNESAGLTMSHNIFSGHTIDLRSISDTSEAPSSLPPATVADYTLWWPEMDAQIIAGTFTHDHDMTGDPDFVAPDSDDYHLDENSAAIDQGTGAGVGVDIDNHPRPMGAGYDLGADEYVNVDLSPSRKIASPQDAVAGSTVTFTILLRNDGTSNATDTTLFDAVPIATTYVPGSAQAAAGTITRTGNLTGTLAYPHGIRWTGTITPGKVITITFQVTINQNIPIKNTAVVTDGYGTSITLTAWVNAQRLYLPLVTRN
ncbi:MAG: DUF11 domain-containing protein [Chloroflexi bacterium]|nr:DUF11 domain-containing protein [Chloroflexota bacterium]